MRDEIKRPEPAAYLWHDSGQEAPGAAALTPTIAIPDSTNTPLYTRADVIAWARAVVESQRPAEHDPECYGARGFRCVCALAGRTRAITAALDSLDTAAREWEEEENA